MTERSRAMVLESPRLPLVLSEDRPLQTPSIGEVSVRVKACGVCRTDLHVVDGELPNPKLPLIPGHEIVGTVVSTGPGVSKFKPGDEVGVPWLGWTCGKCAHCLNGRENLCDLARFTGYQIDGGYADFVIADERFCLRLSSGLKSENIAPLMCAGLIGYRALQFVREARLIGLYGFGASAHITAQVAKHLGHEVYAFTRPGDLDGQQFARNIGVDWAGSSDTSPPNPLDAAIIFAAAGELVPVALSAVSKGGVVVCAGIHMSDIPTFPYRLLWGERTLRSVANLTRRDGEEFLSVAADAKVRTTVETFPLTSANEVLDRIREGRVKGAAVLLP